MDHQANQNQAQMAKNYPPAPQVDLNNNPIESNHQPLLIVDTMGKHASEMSNEALKCKQSPIVTKKRARSKSKDINSINPSPATKKVSLIKTEEIIEKGEIVVPNESVTTVSKKAKALPEQATRIMKEWYEQNAENPYPSEEQRKRMALEGSITENQVKAWFANKRNRSNNTRPKNNHRNRTNSHTSHDSSPYMHLYTSSSHNLAKMPKIDPNQVQGHSLQSQCHRTDDPMSTSGDHLFITGAHFNTNDDHLSHFAYPSNSSGYDDPALLFAADTMPTPHQQTSSDLLAYLQHQHNSSQDTSTLTPSYVHQYFSSAQNAYNPTHQQCLCDPSSPSPGCPCYHPNALYQTYPSPFTGYSSYQGTSSSQHQSQQLAAAVMAAAAVQYHHPHSHHSHHPSPNHYINPHYHSNALTSVGLSSNGIYESSPSVSSAASVACNTPPPIRYSGSKSQNNANSNESTLCLPPFDSLASKTPQSPSTGSSAPKSDEIIELGYECPGASSVRSSPITTRFSQADSAQFAAISDSIRCYCNFNGTCEYCIGFNMGMNRYTPLSKSHNSAFQQYKDTNPMLVNVALGKQHSNGFYMAKTRQQSDIAAEDSSQSSPCSASSISPSSPPSSYSAMKMPNNAIAGLGSCKNFTNKAQQMWSTKYHPRLSSKLLSSAVSMPQMAMMGSIDNLKRIKASKTLSSFKSSFDPSCSNNNNSNNISSCSSNSDVAHIAAAAMSDYMTNIDEHS